MPNKEFYSKKIGNLELCLVCGWVGDNKCVVFYRNHNGNTTIDFGILDRKIAFETYETEIKKNGNR
jgi:hypothetical protein